MKRPRIIIALVASLGLHGVLYVVLENQDEAGIAEAHKTLSITLTTEVNAEPVPEPLVQKEAPADEPDLAEQITQQLLTQALPIEHTPLVEQSTPFPTLTTATPKLDTANLSARELVMALPDEQNVSSFQAFLQPECSATERASLALACDPNADLALQHSFTAAETSVFEAAFRNLSSTYRDFNRDMNTVSQLVENRANLSPLDPNDPLQVALVAEQRRNLRAEIIRLDRKYAEVNLLRLIPISNRIVKGLNSVGSSK